MPATRRFRREPPHSKWAVPSVSYASERDSPKFVVSFSSPASRISPQSRHSTYCESSSLAIKRVRVCWQEGFGGFVIAVSVQV